MSNIHELLLKIRESKGFSLREAAKRSGLSHSYIDIMEKGIHPKSKSPILPSPESLKAIAKAYNYDYEELMIAAGHIEESKKEQEEYPLPKNQYDWIVKEAEAEFGVSLRDDPVVEGAVRELVRRLAEMKKK